MRLDFGLLLAASEPWSRRQRLNHHSPPLSRLGCRLRGGDQVSVAMLARHDYLHDTAAFALVIGFIDAIGEDHRHNAFQTRKSSAPKTYCCNSRPSIFWFKNHDDPTSSRRPFELAGVLATSVHGRILTGMEYAVIRWRIAQCSARSENYSGDTEHADRSPLDRYKRRNVASGEFVGYQSTFLPTRADTLSRNSLVDQRMGMFPFGVPPLGSSALGGSRFKEERPLKEEGRPKVVLRTHPFGLPLVKPCHPA